MVAARAELFNAGHLAPLTALLAARLPARTGLVLDVGAGTGHHLAALLDARPGSVGVALDVSKAAARRSAHAHPAIGVVVADVWRRLPLVDGCVDVLLDVFAPRHGPEFQRVLRPDGTLIVVTPASEHLAELVGPLGLLTVESGKAGRLEESLGRWFEPVQRDACRYGLPLSRSDVARFVAMGPSAWHRSMADVAGRLAGWAEPVAVTFSVELTSYRPRR
jgi:23S rRNA (guanine745-N1)-methyltransferase